ncbi:translation initiation factor IF-1 [Candidatus Shapirobacteria bacterium RIFOXYD1_FULL_38_32]|jgi:translation initiation factor IF-1|uniref:Translation initiation factor IF-1 n=3 Tax=Candidatus Shapironibacteriota TaxID=1752721 RepID=A0A0G0K7W8_9BACT|nr:MAG: Translation initiation factor IF-1 [Candidatus Shapirobacteria bacterium GW2011_GWE2_38_30]KKQ91232.1 MAG: Translation initiation factor IF-1 [Candidatus Shapirobacteria bacterium GW2011_GWE1_38_92]OGL55881.1 MAG: translation initiation factor IF-1 [Candidatus Shapirobacteria bacterium RIFOXYA1_FULL_39_17]OGL56834.1 MAG: translation initiation factor IF-1 [Candidatus Shapirobacteria bacterium RIFOXYC1_FULL_38_24]OGL57128.1 MAG: translation initiation factor IF-1 [Candidatus Shapirobacte
MSDEPKVQGLVTEVLPNSLYRVKLEDDRLIIAHLAGKLRLHRIRVIAGDSVTLVLSPEGEKGRIVYRN